MAPFLIALLLSQAPAEKPVTKEIAAPCSLLASNEAARLCMEATMREVEASAAAIGARQGSFARETLRLATEAREKACKAARPIELTAGTVVEVSSNPDVCADQDKPLAPTGLIRVRVTAGKDAGTIGCVRPRDLRDPVPF
jgi:hypothetical protein